MTQLPKDHISVSQFNMFLRCPRQYQYRYVEDIKKPPGWVMITGKAGHSGLEYNNLSKLATGEKASFKDIYDVYYTAWEKSEKEEEHIIFGETKPHEAKKQGETLLKEYYTTSIDSIRIPIQVEQKLELAIPEEETTILGFADVVYPGDVKDYKFSKKTPSLTTLFNSIQLPIYGMAYKETFGEYPENLSFDYFIANKKPKIATFSFAREEKFYKDTYKEIITIIKAIKVFMQLGFFYRNTTNFMCNPNDCGYYSNCRPNEKKLYYEIKNKDKEL